MPYLKILAVWLLPGALAVLLGRTAWGLTWPDTWTFAVLAVVLMFLPGFLGAATRAHFLGSDLRGGKSIGSDLLDGEPFIFRAPWVLVSVLAAALALEINYLD